MIVAPPPSGSQSTSTVSTGSGRPFRRSSPTGGTGGGCGDRPWPAPHRRPGPARLAAGTEPGRLDDRVPEVVAVLPGDLAPLSPPAAPPSARGAVVLFDALLHGDPAGQGGRGRGEDHHEPVTQVLHLGAARSRRRPGAGSRSAPGGPRRPSGESRWDSSVEPTMSVNRIATFSVVIGVPLPPRATGDRGHGRCTPGGPQPVTPDPAPPPVCRHSGPVVLMGECLRTCAQGLTRSGT